MCLGHTSPANTGSKEDKFRITFATDASMQILENVPEDEFQGITYMTDCTHKLTQRCKVWKPAPQAVGEQDDVEMSAGSESSDSGTSDGEHPGDAAPTAVVTPPAPADGADVGTDAAAAAAPKRKGEGKGKRAAKGKGKSAKQKKRKQEDTNALIACIGGFLTTHYEPGKAHKKNGKMKKWRQSFNMLAITLSQGGGSEELNTYNLSNLAKHVRAHYPKAAARLKSAAVACSDDSGGAKQTMSHFGATTNDNHTQDGHVFTQASKCQLRTCQEHFMDNAVGNGKTRKSKLHSHGLDKDDIADQLRARLMTWTRRMDIVRFDQFWHFFSMELRAGTIQGIGKQGRWVRYIERTHLFKEDVLEVKLWNASFRAGSDRTGTRPTDNPAESYNNKIKAKLNAIRDRLPQLTGTAGRPTLPALVRQFEHALKTDPARRARIDDGPSHIRPPRLDANLVTGNAMITKHTDRLPSKAWAMLVAEGRGDEYCTCAAYTRTNTSLSLWHLSVQMSKRIVTSLKRLVRQKHRQRSIS